jgi:membrane protein DedA with SNARE-associated domain/rhodanese-related sulfurtransferase
MQHVILSLAHFAVLIVFLNSFVTQAGMPVPIMPTLLAVTAMAGQNPVQIAEVAAAAIGGAVLGDCLPYWCGRRYGTRILGLLCRVSFSPDFCVRQTEVLFGKIGPWSLLVAKFFPGLSLLSVAMAGVTRMSAPTFVLLDGAGKVLFVGATVALGMIFHNAIDGVLRALTGFGEFGVAAVAAAFALYIAIRWLRRRLFIRQLRMDRITVAELLKLVDDGEDPVILDVRPKEIRALDGMIPHAVSGSPSDLDRIVNAYSHDAEIIVYCACPNEESAAMAAKHLKQAGFKKIRPLLGGIDAWVDAGHPLVRGLAADESVAPPQRDAGTMIACTDAGASVPAGNSALAG